MKSQHFLPIFQTCLSQFLTQNLLMEMRAVILRKNLANVHSSDSLSSSPKGPMVIYSSNSMQDKKSHTELLRVIDTAFELMLMPMDPKHHHDPC